MKFQHLPLIALLFFSSLAQAALLRQGYEGQAAMELKSSAAATTSTLAKQEQANRGQELILPEALPPVLHDIIRDYLFGAGGEAFFSILYRPTIIQDGGYKYYSYVAISHNENIITSEHLKKSIQIWDKSGALIKTIPLRDILIPNTTHQSPDKSALVTVIVSGLINDLVKFETKIINMTDYSINTIQNPAVFYTIATTSQAKIIFAGCAETTKAFDNTGQCIATFTDPTDTNCITQLAVTPDGKTLVTISRDGPAKIWDTTESNIAKKCIATLPNTDCIAISDDGNTIITNEAKQGSIKIYDRTGNCKASIPMPDIVHSFTIRSGGNIIVSLDNGKIKTFSFTGECECLADLTSTERKIWGCLLAASPDNKTYVTGSVCSHVTPPAHHTLIHTFDNDAHKTLYNLTFTQLKRLKQLVDDFCQQAVSKLSNTFCGQGPVPAAIVLSPEQGHFLFSLPALLQNNIRNHFGITETQEEFEKRTDQDKKSCK